jgi:hypothetical protein
MKIKNRFLITMILLMILLVPSVPILAASDADIYIPIVMHNSNFTANKRTVNAPYFNSSDLLQSNFNETAVFWFGKLGTNQSSTDVRVAYNNSELVVYTTTYDRVLSYNPNSNGTDLTQWDTASLAIQTSPADSNTPGSNTYRFLVGARFYEPQNDPNFQATYRGNGTGWSVQSIPFVNQYGHATGDGNADDRGWAIVFRIPFSSLGVTKPPDGTLWRFHLDIYNRNSDTGPSLGSQEWPMSSNANVPSTWGQLRFGMPVFSPPTLKNLKTITIRDKLNGSVVDATVGGGTLCGDAAGPSFYPTWGSLNYTGETPINIQNQGLIADWPCFARSYITFPLTSVPPGKLIRSAKLIMRHMGGSNPSNAAYSMIQVLTVSEEWNETTINWNNAPLAKENISISRVDVYEANWSDPNIFQNLPAITWDVSRAVQDAVNYGTPLRLALYSSDWGADNGINTGKYFYSSDADDGIDYLRPKLVIEYVDP